MLHRMQAKSRRKIAEAVKQYVRLRAADGEYSDVVQAIDREGRKVVVFVTLNIVSEETSRQG